MIKRNLFTALVTGCIGLLGLSSNAQLFISSGATFQIQSGAVVTVQGDVTSSADILGPGKLQLKGAGNQNLNMNGFTIPNLEIDNVANTTLTGNTRIGTDLLFTNGNIQVGNFNLSMSSTGTITSSSNTKYIVTNGTGSLIKESLGASAFLFPVGNSLTSYNPITISNSGTVDNIGARVLAQSYANGLTGTAFSKEVVDATWDLSEAVAGGSSLSMTAEWRTTQSDELTGFDRTKSGISNYIATAGPTQGWDLLNSQVGAATGTNPYTFTRTGVSNLGAFAIGTRPVLSPLLVSPKIYLQGPFNTTTSVMADGLRTIAVASGGTTDATHGVIPVADPYTGLSGFTHSGSGGGETISTGVFGVFNVTNNDAIVDWVFVQLHDGVTGTVLSTRAALLQRDGDVVETDGVSPVNMAGNAAGNYYVSVRHRNHLGVRSLSNIALAKTSTTVYNFTTGLGQAFAGAVANNPMAALTPTASFGLWGGDATGNKQTRYSGGGNDQNQLLNISLGGNVGASLNGVYNRSDLNMNGRVTYSGGANDQNILLNVVLGGLIGAVLTQPSF